MSNTWRTSGEREREIESTNRPKKMSTREGWRVIKGNRCTRKAFWLRIVPERELIFFFITIDHCIGSPHNAAATSVRDQPCARVRCPAGPRTVTKMSKISGYAVLFNRYRSIKLSLSPPSYRVGSVNFSRRKLGHAHDNSADSENVPGAREPSVHAHFIFRFEKGQGNQSLFSTHDQYTAETSQPQAQPTDG